MKIDTVENSNLKVKVEKFFRNENSDLFREILDGEMSYLSGMNNFNEINDFCINDFITSQAEDIKNLKSSYKYDCLTMDRDDALFFANSIKGENYTFSVNGEVLMNNMATDIQSVAKTYKSAAVSKTLADMLANSQTANKPVRIDFGNDISAIFRVSKDGKISAEFLPSNAAAEEYLKNNISYLQKTFEEQKLPYNELSYRQSKNQNKQQNKNGKGE